MNNFWEVFAAAAERHGTLAAVEIQRRDGLETFSYAQLQALAEGAAAALVARGIAPGDRCAILADNDAHWCAAYLGILRTGGVGVPLDTHYSARQIAALLRDSEARLAFASDAYQETAKEAVRQAGTPCEILPLRSTGAPGVALGKCPAARADPAVILYTSGTTSDPKGVVLTHGNLLAERDAVFQIIDVNERDTILGVLPLFHALPQLANLLLPFVVGARVVFLETLSTTELLRALRERGVTIFCCVPQFFYLIHQRVMQEAQTAGRLQRSAFRALLRANGFLRESLGVNCGRFFFRRIHDVLGARMRLLVTGGSRFDPAVGRDLYRLGFNILQAYGLTECSGAATVNRPGDPQVDSVGQPLPGVEVKIAPAEFSGNGARDGEVLIRGPIVMQGYYRREAANAETLRDGWLYTGDLGTLDSTSHLRITGRKKDVIILSSGKNIYPEEVEAHYQQSPYIKEMCVMGLERPGEPAAERLHAVVVPEQDVMRERKVVNMREILRFEIEGLGIPLPSHKRVLSYEIWTEDLPRTTTRKLKRFEIARRRAERASSAEAAGAPGSAETAAERSARAPLTGADRAWAAEPDVARALAVIEEVAKNKGAIHPDANIELELGLDSIERVELLTKLEQEFGSAVPVENWQKIYTVRELVEAVRGPEGTGAAAEKAADAWSSLFAQIPEEDEQFSALLRPHRAMSALVFVLLKISRNLARILFGLRVRGAEAVDLDGPFLICPNHQTFLDGFLLVATLPWRVFRRIFFVGASEYFVTPLSAWFARQTNIVPVDPDSNLVRAMQAGAFGLRNGMALILFPEGERSVDGEIKTFKKGAAILSQHLRAPIVPVAIRGAFEFWPRGQGFQWRACLPGNGRRITLEMGAPLTPPEPWPTGVSMRDAEAQYASATERLRARVQQMWNEWK
jgi:long-chain acyl-CoA synthetase